MANRIKDLTGKRFGYLTAIKLELERTKNKTVIWLCECDCGKLIKVPSNILCRKIRPRKSCGCKFYTSIKIGDKFGKFTVIEKSPRKGNWKCLCECGASKIVGTFELTKGIVTQCNGFIHKLEESNRYGKFTVIERLPNNKSGNKVWRCLCDCGKEKIIIETILGSGRQPSCGCDLPNGKAHHSWRGCGEIHLAYWNHVLRGATSRDFEISITIEDAWNKFIEQDRKCALSGIEIYFTKIRKPGYNSTASLDRIDSKKGYTIDNIQWIHKDINKMKMDMPESNFIQWCHLISKNKT